jgi:hypothetical protein
LVLRLGAGFAGGVRFVWSLPGWLLPSATGLVGGGGEPCDGAARRGSRRCSFSRWVSPGDSSGAASRIAVDGGASASGAFGAFLFSPASSPAAVLPILFRRVGFFGADDGVGGGCSNFVPRSLAASSPMAVDASSPSTGRKLVAAVRSSSMVRLGGDLRPTVVAAVLQGLKPLAAIGGGI